ncbi:MAG: C39 family peptidase [Anaerolineae bacterium]|nr:C39 family peptidase [Anaerolineae bacterium]
MTRTSTLSGLLALLSVTLTAIAMILVVGTVRYGGPENLMRRVRSEVMAHRPHPDFVPTPFATANGEAVASLEGGDIFPAATTSDAAMAADQGEPATPTSAYRVAAPSVKLTGLSHMWQTWNNCGPATLAMNLSYYGSTLSQADVGAALRLYEDDKNVGPEEMAVFARSQGFNALMRVNGDADRLRLLLSNNVPVLVETWHEPEPNDGMGHYRLLVGYDDATNEWIAYDSYDSRGVDPSQPYAGIRVPYDELDQLWSVFNRTYVLIYTDEFAPVIEGILGEDMDDATMWQRALQHAWAETQARADDPFAWFNLGSDLVALGQFEQAAMAYDHARQMGLPWRMLWYQFGPFQAYYETARYQEVVTLADATIKTTSSIEEICYWKGMALKAQGDIAGARQAWRRSLELNPNYAEATAALAGLEP